MVVRDAVHRDSLVRAKFNTINSCPPLSETLALAVLERQGRIVGRSLSTPYREPRHRRRVGRPSERRRRMGAARCRALCCVRLRLQVFDAAAVERCSTAMHEQEVRVARGDLSCEHPRLFRLGFGLADAQGLRSALDALTRALDAGR
jgi:hypothetical protein